MSLGSGWRQALYDVFRRRRRALAAVCAWSFVESVPAFLSGRLVAAALDDGFLAGKAMVGFGWLAVLAAGVLVGAVGTRQTSLRMAGVVEPFRDELARMAVNGALRRCTGFDDAGDTAAVARLTHQVELVRESFAGVIMAAQGFVITTISALLGLLTLLPLALVLVFPPIVVGLTLFLASLAAIAAKQRASVLADERIAESTTQLAGGLRDIVACGAEERVATDVGTDIDAQQSAALSLARLTALRTIALGVGGWLPVLLLLVGAPWLAANGASAGMILGALTYAMQALQPALQTLVRTVSGSGLWLAVTLGRLVETAGGPLTDPADPDPADPGPACPRPQARGYGLELRGVTFRYSPSAEPVVEDLDLAVSEGTHLAVVGPSGAGKSTLAGILTGVLGPQAGRVLLGGVELGELASAELVGSRVLIPQQAYVFSGTLAENLRYLHLGASVADIDRAIDALRMRPLVERLGGLDAELAPAELSAGERQLVTLARAYLCPGRLIVLDEATCHLDAAAEAVVERAFSLRQGTLVVIAHRISSALRAERVLLMDGDRVVLGRHHELLARSPLYRDLNGYWQEGAGHAGEARIPRHLEV